jgi:hypothetical protein
MARRDGGIDVPDEVEADRRTGAARAPEAPTSSPAADRPTRSRWRDPRLALGLAVVALCAVLGARLLDGADDTVGVWVARGALPAGQPVTGPDLARREVRFEGQSDADRYVSADDALPAGATLGRPVGAGEMLPRAALRAGDSGGLTEVPLALGADAVPVSVRAGTTVDVWVVPERAPDASVAAAGRPVRSRLVFDDVAVVAAPEAGTSLGPSTTRSVVVGVPTGRPRRLAASIAALADGDLLLTVRQ